MEWFKLPARKRTLASKNTAFTFLYPSFMYLQLVDGFKWIVCNSDCQNKVWQTENLASNFRALHSCWQLDFSRRQLTYREIDAPRRFYGNKRELINSCLALSWGESRLVFQHGESQRVWESCAGADQCSVGKSFGKKSLKSLEMLQSIIQIK